MPRAEIVKKAIEQIRKRSANYEYFFKCLNSPDWIEPLRSSGFFLAPPQPKYEGEYISFPPWPESRYLARMAALKPDVVLDVILDVPDTSNVRVYEDFADAALNMPPKLAARLVEKAKKWACSRYQQLLPEKLGVLMGHLAKGGRADEALDLARVLLEILPDPTASETSTDETYNPLPRPRARFDTWDYERILKKDFPDLVKVAGMPAMGLLCDLLETAIRLSQTSENNQWPEDYSYIWCPDIENRTHDTPRDILVTMVLDTTESLVKNNHVSVQDIVSILEERPWRIFQRIALSLLRCFHDAVPDLVASRLTNQSLFEEFGLRHEYALLAERCFMLLTTEQQQIIMNWIEQGPDLQSSKETYEQQMGKWPIDEDVIHAKKIWQRDRLSWFKTHLSEDWRQRYEALVVECGEPNHSFPYHTSVFRTGLDSPKNAEELQTMTVADIISLLKTWKPPEGFSAPSPEGLGRVLLSAISHDPERFAREATLFQELDPTYVRALLEGFSEAVKKNCVFAWPPVLALCRWVMDQPREIQGRRTKSFEADPDWGWTRRTITDLFEKGFKDGPGGIPFEYYSIVWDIVYSLTDDPDPTPEREAKSGEGNMDPVMLSVNTTRGEAMHTVVRYASWIRRHLEKLPDAKERVARGFDEMPEVREVLDEHLNVYRDSSRAVRSVYGQWFPWLVLLDPVWAKSRVAQIFPADQSNGAFRDAAWETYMVFCDPYDSVLEVLRDEYAAAVERFGSLGSSQLGKRLPADPKKRLAEHLMTFYWRGKLDVPGFEDILTRFWINADNYVRGHAIEFVGRSLEHTKEGVPHDILRRLQVLWESRLMTAKEAAIPEDYKAELAAFGWWFVSSKFDDQWSITQLTDALKIAGKTDPDYLVVKHLATFSQNMPDQVIQCLEKIIKGDHEEWFICGHMGDIRTVLMILQDSKVSGAAERLINYLGSRGYVEFRDLLPKR